MRLPSTMRAAASAPRDGTEVFIIETGYSSCPLAVRARVCDWWVTDEFIPSGVAAGDTAAANHGAIPDHCILGWLPLDQEHDLQAAGLIPKKEA